MLLILTWKKKLHNRMRLYIKDNKNVLRIDWDIPSQSWASFLRREPLALTWEISSACNNSQKETVEKEALLKTRLQRTLQMENKQTILIQYHNPLKWGGEIELESSSNTYLQKDYPQKICFHSDHTMTQQVMTNLESQKIWRIISNLP